MRLRTIFSTHRCFSDCQKPNRKKYSLHGPFVDGALGTPVRQPSFPVPAVTQVFPEPGIALIPALISNSVNDFSVPVNGFREYATRKDELRIAILKKS